MKKISSHAKAVLSAREKRHVFKQDFMQKNTSLTYVEISMNIPGIPKTGHQWHLVFQMGIKQLQAKFDVVQWTSFVDQAGYYALMSTKADTYTVKYMCCEVEKLAPWGRLLDIDCSGPNGRLSRQSLGLPDRLCMVCHGPQEACLSSKAHSLEQARLAANKLAEQVHCSL